MSTLEAIRPFDLDLLPCRFAHVFQPHKSQISQHALQDLFQFIWTRDTFVFHHPRYRIQTALTILLIYHLGIHPTVALREGFFYKDTRLVATKKDGVLRVALMICLLDRKTAYNSEKRWKAVPMIIADNPRRRYMCPVTLFLALAISDGIISQVNGPEDLLSLEVPQWPTWTTIPYRQETGIAIIRCTWNQSRNMSPVHAMKPSSLDKMMRAQIKRANHTATMAAIVEDNKRTSRAMKKLNEDGTLHPILIGRGQGELVYDLLGNQLLSLTNTPWNISFINDGNCELRPAMPLVDEMQAQLRYDPSRLDIISYLFGACNYLINLPDILWPFVEASNAVPYELYFQDAEPNETGGCPWCCKRHPRYA
ncbi:hypothetical protein P154DRAFT_576229 [Amniculicola lignicola CBS 123094]|uniref:Uncharacterized protein n=1 Tax=Amniculicola lignicola CBS 123094 TaxID=1392246 RepID=A0A6A5WEB0_9PLEO|nr:hypothetical protein P154DRAFT_576229 [Amniculicola lignicola CBS 123094]